jgi:hypothetical protein
MDAQSIVAERERVAEMCASCDIEYLGRFAAEDRLWIARKWCNNIGERVVGSGRTAWEAVQSAHALHASHDSDR